MESITEKVDPKVKDILRLLAAGGLVAASIFLPGLTYAAKPFIDREKENELNKWKRFNKWRLKQILKRLQNQKFVEIFESKNGYKVKITEKGRQRLLQYNLDDLSLQNKQWDKKWRIIIYDIDESKRALRNVFQKFLKKLDFLQLQESVYLTPYACENEIEYLRQLYSVGSEVIILTVSGFENERVYRDYFGL